MKPMAPTWCNFRQLTLAAVLACAAIAAGGCVRFGAAEMNVWAAGEMAEIDETSTPVWSDPAYDPDAKAIHLSAAANETVSFQIVLDATAEGLRDVRVRFSDLSKGEGAVLPADRIELFRMWPVTVAKVPAWRHRLGVGRLKTGRKYDVLIPSSAPRNGMPFEVGPSERLALWVDVPVGRSVVAGRYVGVITISGRVGAGLTAPPVTTELRLSLVVHNFVLPDTRPVIAVGRFDHRRLFSRFLTRGGKPFRPVWMDRADPLVAEGLVLMRQLMTLAHAHRLDLFETTIRPTMKRDAFGAARLYWDDYDAVVKPYLDGTAFADRIGVPAWPAPLTEAWPAARSLGGVDAPEYRETFGSLAAATAEHFDDLGFADRLFFWPVRDADAPDRYDRFVRTARLIRAYAPSSAILIDSPPDAPGYDGLYDILAPPAHQLDPDRLSPPPREGMPLAGVYLVPGSPPYSPSLALAASPADIRAVPWLAMRANLSGVLLGDVLGWDDDPFRVVGESVGEKLSLFYPGDPAGLDRVLAGVRLKRLRRGLQDVGYIRLLTQRRRGELADRITQTMARYVGLQADGDHAGDPRLDGWAADGALWEQARRLLAAEVIAADPMSTGPSPNALTMRLSRQALIDAARPASVERISTRINPVVVGAETKLHVKLSADIYNGSPDATDVMLWLPEPPQGVRLIGRVAKRRLAPWATETLEVDFECPLRSAGGAGKLSVPLRLNRGADRTETLSAKVPILLSRPTSRPVVVDGNLSEWPIRSGGSAGDFGLLGRRGRDGHQKPLWRTDVFVQHDAEFLYLAFRCDLPGDAPVSVRATNGVRYDQLLAVDEDLVEVILDPGADGSTASDVYRMIVKANGVLVSGRGAPTDSTMAATSDWSSGAKVAVGRDDAAMFVEIAMPRASVGAEGADWRWGVNFARFATGAMEASNWSQTPRHYYDPRNLGALLLLDDP